jgi:hypothetical protein
LSEFGAAMIPPPPPPSSPSEARPPGDRSRALDPKASASLALGLFGLLAAWCGLGLLLSLPAILLGAASCRDVGRSKGELRGRGLATAGIVCGALGSALFFAWALLVIRRSTTQPHTAIAPLIELLPVPASRVPAPFAPREEANWDQGVALRRVGGPLRRQLAAQVDAARGKGQTVLVETVAADCEACDEIDRAMREPTVREALPNIRLVYVQTDEFHSELGWLRMDESTAPWFYLLDARGEPRDAIGADEWDANVAPNIGPILHAFVVGELRKRRHEWHGGATL